METLPLELFIAKFLKFVPMETARLGRSTAGFYKTGLTKRVFDMGHAPDDHKWRKPTVPSCECDRDLVWPVLPSTSPYDILGNASFVVHTTPIRMVVHTFSGREWNGIPTFNVSMHFLCPHDRLQLRLGFAGYVDCANEEERRLKNDKLWQLITDKTRSIR